MNNQMNIAYEAFPRNLKKEITNLNKLISLRGVLPNSDSFTVKVENEAIQIPYRIYLNEPHDDLEKMLDSKQKQILSCFLTRHHDGHVREKRLREIIFINEPWVVPFVLQLVGEYVSEILMIIEENIEHIEVPNYIKFIRENRDYFNTIKQRVASYWDCYYRISYPNFEDFVGFRIIKYFEKHLRNQSYID